MRPVGPWLRADVDTTVERRRWLVGTFLVAAVFRVVLFFSGAVSIIITTRDGEEYRALAESLLRHGVFGFDGVPKMNRTPGFPAFLALVYATVGRSDHAVMGVHIALDALTCVLVTSIAIRMRLNRAGVALAAASSALCLFLAGQCYQVMTEALFTLLLTAAVWVLPLGGITKIASRAAWPRLAVSGFLIGLATLVRVPAAFIVVGFLSIGGALALKMLGRSALARNLIVGAAVFGAAASVAIVPWIMRNRLVFHDDYAAPNDNLTPFGWKTEYSGYRHWYSDSFMHWVRSYEQPFVMMLPWEPPETARYVYPEEKEEVIAAFKPLKVELEHSTTGVHGIGDMRPVPDEILDRFRVIADKRYAAAPRLYLTASLSRLVRFWVAPRVSVLFSNNNGVTVGLPLTVGLTLYNCLYVFPGLVGIMLGWRRAPLLTMGVVATAASTWIFLALWHAAVNSRYTVPLFPLICVGIGVFATSVSERGLRPAAWTPRWLARRKTPA